jgi:hypothetical protein
MAMEHTFVAHLFSPALTFGRDVVNFQKIIVFEVQSTPAASSCLLLQELAFDPAQQVVFAESLAPIHEVSIIWACSSLDFHMMPDMRLGMIP